MEQIENKAEKEQEDNAPDLINEEEAKQAPREEDVVDKLEKLEAEPS